MKTYTQLDAVGGKGGKATVETVHKAEPPVYRVLWRGTTRAIAAAEIDIAKVLRRVSAELGQPVKAVKIAGYADGSYRVKIVPGKK